MTLQRMLKPMLIGVGVVFVLGLAGLPVLNYLPLLILLACPIMMLFMMGHGGHGGMHDDGRDSDTPQHVGAGHDQHRRS